MSIHTCLSTVKAVATTSKMVIERCANHTLLQAGSKVQLKLLEALLQTKTESCSGVRLGSGINSSCSPQICIFPKHFNATVPAEQCVPINKLPCVFPKGNSAQVDLLDNKLKTSSMDAWKHPVQIQACI